MVLASEAVAALVNYYSCLVVGSFQNMMADFQQMKDSYDPFAAYTMLTIPSSHNYRLLLYHYLVMLLVVDSEISIIDSFM